jgi:CubicO group peptidase (beta-lactamase class C family)
MAPVLAAAVLGGAPSVASDSRTRHGGVAESLERADAVVRGGAPAGLEPLIEKAMRDWKIPGLAIAVVRADKIVYARGFGVRDLVAGGAVTPDTVFGIGSVTKSFTATSLAMLVDRGKLTWDAPVRNTLPAFQTNDPYVTGALSLRDIACHRTGIEDANYLQWRPTQRADLPRHPTRNDILRAFRHLRPSEPFRSRFAYRNAPWVVAGAAIEAASGRSWDDFVHQELFSRLHMERSSTSVNETDALDDVSSVHVRNHSGVLVPIAPVNADVPGPMGSINSTALDMAQYLRLHLGAGAIGADRILSAAALGELHEPQMVDHGESLTSGTPFSQQISYGLGWWTQDYRGSRLVHHSGSIVGGNANVAFLPAHRLGVVVLINARADLLAEAISLQTLDAFLGADSYDWTARASDLARARADRVQAAVMERARARSADTVPSLPLQRYAGVYRHAVYGDLHVSEVDGQLAVALWSFTGKLAHWHYDTFALDWDERHYYLPSGPRYFVFARFEVDETGMPSRLHFLNMGEFVRVDSR